MRSLALLLAVVVTAQAQSASVTAARDNWREGHNFVVRSAEMLPDSLYSWKPVASVRSFADQLGHVAGTEMMYCAAILGEPSRAEDAIEKSVKNKAGLVKALKDAASLCDRAYALTDAAANAKMSLFGSQNTKLYFMINNANHSWEHYGNLVTYLRIRGLVPPSSQ